MRFFSYVFLLILFLGTAVKGQVLFSKSLVVELAKNSVVSSEYYFSSAFDRNIYEINADYLPMNFDLGFEEIAIFSDCFEPDLKIVTEDYTYLISFYTGEGLMLENKSPFIPQMYAVPKKVRFDESVVDMLIEIKNSLFREQGHYFTCFYGIEEEELMSWEEQSSSWEKEMNLDFDIKDKLNDDLTLFSYKMMSFWWDDSYLYDY